MKNYFSSLKNHALQRSLVLALCMLAASLVMNYYAAGYATSAASNSVTDIILSNTRVYDVDGAFIYGALLMVAIIAILCFSYPQKAPFIIKSIALFIVIRSVFITLTHLSPYPYHATIDSVFFNKAYFQGIFNGDDLFFSGHTGLPFLMALIFWDNKILRYIFLVSSLLFGVVVLLGHLHYSIDVLSAFFITYAIFHISIYLFKKDWKIFSEGLPKIENL